MQSGKIGFSKKVNWSELDFKQFSSIYGRLIDKYGGDTVEAVAKSLGVKKVPKEKKTGESQ